MVHGNCYAIIIVYLHKIPLCPIPWNTVCYIMITVSGGSRIFPSGGANSQSGYANLFFWSKTAWKWKNFGPRGGGAHPWPFITEQAFSRGWDRMGFYLNKQWLLHKNHRWPRLNKYDIPFSRSENHQSSNICKSESYHLMSGMGWRAAVGCFLTSTLGATYNKVGS